MFKVMILCLAAVVAASYPATAQQISTYSYGDGSMTASRNQARAYRGEIPESARTAVLDRQGQFEALDKNDNKELTVNEFMSSRSEEELFRRIDKNRNHSLTDKELQAYANSSPKTSGAGWLNFSQLNTDGGKTISEMEFEELNNRTPVLFDILDRDHDKMLSPAETQAYMKPYSQMWR